MSSDTNRELIETVGTREIASNFCLVPKENLCDPDPAYNFLANVNTYDDAAAQVDLKKLRRKIDWYIVPIMFLCYTMQFVDKISLNVSGISSWSFG